MSSYIKIELSRIDDGSLFYHNLKNCEKFRTFIAVDAKITGTDLAFHSGGHGYLFDLNKWTVIMKPII